MSPRLFCLSAAQRHQRLQLSPPIIAGKTDPAQRAQIHTERAAEYYKLGKLAIALEVAQQAVSEKRPI
ncbi:MAG: hypothetical protein HC782_02575 [Gammaproteobacteria bacterium]|nr:hypothetical protein [Gammaproteobacteria bacterium]